MEMTVTRLPDGGVRYESDKAIVTVYERGRMVRNGEFTDEGKKAIESVAARMRAEKERSA